MNYDYSKFFLVIDELADLKPLLYIDCSFCFSSGVKISSIEYLRLNPE